jgi:two-component system, chemotaxis family, protein-glutamate methylesterase/glutaminase
MNDNTGKKIRVLVVDDSALMSRTLVSILQEDASLDVVGRAKDGLEALALAAELKPDVITMDVEMPRMNGITALKHIMVKHMIPTVMISALTKEGARTSFDALKYGAIDVIAKPSRREDENLEIQKSDIIAKVKRAAAIRMGRSRYIRMSAPTPELKTEKGAADSQTGFIAIGTGTGGYYALLKIIPEIPGDFKDVIIVVILVASRYIEPFVHYLDAHSAVPVRNLKAVRSLNKGVCYICSGEEVAGIESNGDGRFLVSAPQADSNQSEHMPINLMFDAVAKIAGERAVGIIMTGSGEDGADGLKSVRSKGGVAIVQDINNCMDPSMPLAALRKGAVEKILPDYQIVDFIKAMSQS